jgi:hypothetical protein
MTSRIPVSFSWEGTDNPNNPSGTAEFGCDGSKLRIALGNFAEASKLSYLIKSAYEKGRQDAIDRIQLTIPRFLNDQRYD